MQVADAFDELLKKRLWKIWIYVHALVKTWVKQEEEEEEIVVLILLNSFS